MFKSGLYPLLFISSVYLVLIKLKKCHKCEVRITCSVSHECEVCTQKCVISVKKCNNLPINKTQVLSAHKIVSDSTSILPLKVNVFW